MPPPKPLSSASNRTHQSCNTHIYTHTRTRTHTHTNTCMHTETQTHALSLCKKIIRKQYQNREGVHEIDDISRQRYAQRHKHQLTSPLPFKLSERLRSVLPFLKHTHTHTHTHTQALSLLLFRHSIHVALSLSLVT